MQVRIERLSGEAGCTVWLDSCKVLFPSRKEAETFMEQLQLRLQAPHHLPESCLERAGAGINWAVWLKHYKLPFQTQREVETFVEQLQARLQAPHPLPASADQDKYNHPQ